MKEKLIILTIAILSSITMAIAAPTLKNCGKSTLDNTCANDGCRVSFDTSTAITNCELDFDNAPVNGSFTICTANLPQKMNVIYTNTQVNFYPKPPLTSLSGFISYFVCGQSSYQGR